MRASRSLVAAATLVTMATSVTPAFADDTATPGGSDPGFDRPSMCDPGDSSTVVDTVSDKRTVTHAKYVSVPVGARYTLVSDVTRIATIKAGITSEAEVSASGKVVIAEMSAKAKVTLAAEGTATIQTNTSVKAEFGPGRYAAWKGWKEYTGRWTLSTCNPSTGAITHYHGRGTSFAVEAEGAALCTKNYPAYTYEAQAKNQAC